MPRWAQCHWFVRQAALHPVRCSQSSNNLHNVTGIGGFALQRFVKQFVHRCSGQIGVAGFFAAARFIGWTVAADGGGAVDSHEWLRDVGMTGVKLNAAMTDDVVGFEHQSFFDVRIIDKLPHGRESL